MTPAFLRFAYDLGRTRATGEIVATRDGTRLERVEVSEGAVVTSELDALGRQVDERLSRIASTAHACFSFRSGPVVREGRRVPLAAWARRFLERHLDAEDARALGRELDGRRLSLHRDAVPERDVLDSTDLALVRALERPSTIAELSTIARTPTFRVLAFVHFLRTVGALSVENHAAPRAFEPVRALPRHRASDLLGVPPGASGDLVKRAWRRLARTLHPDLHPGLCEAERRELERRLAEVNAAYGELAALAS
jgi:hypothetical protein